MVQAGEEYTYFTLGKYYDFLNTIGLAQPANDNFVLRQIAQAKDFAVYGAEDIGTNLLRETTIIFNSGLYTELGDVANDLFSNFFQYNH